MDAAPVATSTTPPPATIPAPKRVGELPLNVALNMREEAKFLRDAMGISVLETQDLGGNAVLQLPKEIQSREAAQAYLAQKLPGLTAIILPSSKPDIGARAKVDAFTLRHTVKTIQWPLGRRAQGALDDGQRMDVENEFRRMLGVPLRSVLAESEDLLHKEYKEAMEALKLQKEIGFERFMVHGRYRLPVKEQNSAVDQIVSKAQEYGLMNGDESRYVTEADGTLVLDMDPAALKKVVDWTAHGLKAKDGTELVPAASTEPMQIARADYARSQRVGLMLQAMNTTLAAGLPPETRTEAAQEAKVDITKPVTESQSVHAYNVALQKRYVPEESATPPAERYDTGQLLVALARAQRLVDEPRYWANMDKSQQFSHHNQLRAVLKEDITDLQRMLAPDAKHTSEWSQKGLRWLINDSGYNESLRTMGHLMTLVDRPGKDVKVSTDFQLGAAEFANAFHFTPMVMRPRTKDAKEASYFLREQTGQVSFGEKVKRNAFMGIQPIIHSVEPAKQHPVMAGAVVLGLAIYSAYAPKKYSPYAILMQIFEDLEHGLKGQGHSHGEGASEQLKKELSKTKDLLNKLQNEKSPSFRSGFKAGHKAGLFSMAGAFIAWNLVEDVIVHVPLALVSVTVGWIGANATNKVLGPMFNDLGDIGGKFLPDVTHTIRMDAKAVTHSAQTSPLKVFGEVKEFYRDFDEMGALATTRHTADKATHKLGEVLHGMFGDAKKQPARSMA